MTGPKTNNNSLKAIKTALTQHTMCTISLYKHCNAQYNLIMFNVYCKFIISMLLSENIRIQNQSKQLLFNLSIMTFTVLKKLRIIFLSHINYDWWRLIVWLELELNLKELALLITKLDTMLSTIDFFDYRKINELMC